ncbi:MAG: hypothetical protein JSS35_17365 [Proteobacteria bacterium]|nr:hypothetical protein [Pseudomonadota bacterium]
MTRVETVSTSLGDVPMKIVERGAEPVVLVIRGVLPPADYMEWLEPHGADTAFLHLPGMHHPLLRTIGVAAFAQAFDEAVRVRFAGRPVLAVGASAGALVAAAMDAPQIGGRLLIEPFFSTLQLWPLRNWLRHAYSAASPGLWVWLWSVLGIAPDREEERDYRAVLRPGLPILAVVGDRPLQPPRPVSSLPSLAGDADRALLREAGAEIREVSAGHDLSREAPEALQAAVADALAALVTRRPVR